jgi:hypothetical protein
MSNPKAKKTADPFKTRNGKTKLGPLSYAQLEQLLEKESRPKNQAKIRVRMAKFSPPSACSSEITGSNKNEPA